MNGTFKDGFGRKIDYLRLSVTDRCNLRCVYCVPENYKPEPLRDPALTDAEIIEIVSGLARCGISKLRLTGGEPLMRPGLTGLIARLSSIKEINDIALTTNGIFLEEMAADLKRAGLNRINISMDTLDPFKFKQITSTGDLGKLLLAIEKAIDAGLSPVKINIVVFRGVNEIEINNFIKLTKEAPLHVRFIEAMPLGSSGFLKKDRFVSMDEMLIRGAPLIPLSREDYPKGAGPARYFKRPGSVGAVGFISAVSHTFCHACNRLRLSSRGALFPCLDSGKSYDIKKIILNRKPEIYAPELQKILNQKPRRHHMKPRRDKTPEKKDYMCQIGG